MKKFCLAFVLLGVMAACGAPEAAQVEDPNQNPIVLTAAAVLTANAQPTATVASTDTPEPTATPSDTATPRSTSTPRPTATPEATPTPEAPNTAEVFALNYLGEQESGGMKIGIERVFVATRDWLEANDEAFRDLDIFDEYPVIVEVIFRTTNTTDQVLNLRTYTAKAVINGEQVDFDNWWLKASVDDPIQGEILPGAELVGGLYFGVKRSSVPEITAMSLVIPAPLNQEYHEVGDGYSFNLDLSNHIYQEDGAPASEATAASSQE